MSWARGGNFRTDIMKETLRLGPFEWIHFLQLLGPCWFMRRHRELYPTVAFANRRSKALNGVFVQAFWMASTWKRDVWREIVGKASELRVCIYVYMWLCACVWEQTFSLMQWNHCVCVCVSGTNWTHTLLDGAADMYPVANLQCTIFPLTEALPGKACPKRSTIASLRLLILPLFSHLVATWWSATVWVLS